MHTLKQRDHGKKFRIVNLPNSCSREARFNGRNKFGHFICNWNWDFDELYLREEKGYDFELKVKLDALDFKFNLVQFTTWSLLVNKTRECFHNFSSLLRLKSEKTSLNVIYFLHYQSQSERLFSLKFQNIVLSIMLFLKIREIILM